MLKFILENIFQIYYIIILLAIIISYISINFIEKLTKMERLYLLSCYVFSMFGMIIGAKVLSIAEVIMFHKNEYITIFSGFSYMGGVLGFFIFNKVYNLIYKNMPSKISNLELLAVPLIYSISKIACFKVGCCAGINNIPIQIIESIIYFIIFIVFVVLYKKYINCRSISNWCLICLCVSRFMVDFYRSERNGIFSNVDLTQIICGIIIVLCVIELCKMKPQKYIKNK